MQPASPLRHPIRPSPVLKHRITPKPVLVHRIRTSVPVVALRARASSLAASSNEADEAAEAVVWLTRALDFIHTLLDKMVGGLDANRAAREAYEGSLMQHHGFIVKRSFQVGLMTAPSTASMLKCLGTDPDKTTTDVESFVNASRRHLQVLKTFVVHEKLDKLTA